MAMAFSNVYTFGPTFRAEKSNTTRHAAEFWMMEPEIAFADLNDMMNLAEDMMKYVLSYVYGHSVHRKWHSLTSSMIRNCSSVCIIL